VHPIAFIWNDIYIYWSGIVTALGVLAAVFMAFSLRLLQGKRVWQLALILPVSVALSVVLARVVHWYCHWMQYESLRQALTDWSGGGYSLIGAFAGTLLAALLARLCRLTKNLGALLDCLSPGAALGIAVGKLAFLFSSGDRGKMALEKESYHGLPWSTAVDGLSGGVSWRFATFFWESMAAFAVFAALLVLFFAFRSRSRKKGDRRDGDVFLFLIVLIGAAEILLDSTRYDSSFLRSNGFVSIHQIAGAVGLLSALVLFSVRSVRICRLRIWHGGLWLTFLASLGTAGYMEYYVQRHGDLYLFCYSVMLPALLAAVASICVLYALTMAGGQSGRRTGKEPAGGADCRNRLRHLTKMEGESDF
jgi:prolipoprotein diacylglyceryltransferase